MTKLTTHINKMNGKDAYNYLINLIDESIKALKEDKEELNLYNELKRQLENDKINNIFIDWINRTNIL